jgi:hypothetical protein
MSDPRSVVSSFAAAGFALLPHQRRAIETDANVAVLTGDIATGKTFTLAPWILTRDREQLHAVACITTKCAQIMLHGISRALEALQVEYVFDRKPPRGWKALQLETYRDVLTLAGGASIVFRGVKSEWRDVRAGDLFLDDFEACLDRGGPGTVCQIRERAQRALICAYDGARVLTILRERGEIIHALARPGVDQVDRFIASEWTGASA